MKTMLFADDTVSVQSENNNLEKLQNSVNREMTKVMKTLTECFETKCISFAVLFSLRRWRPQVCLW